MPAKPPVWAWCVQCEVWVGSVPPLLPPLWSNTKAAYMHRQGTGHVVKLRTWEKIAELALQARNGGS
jgi:hypothetical protein